MNNFKIYTDSKELPFWNYKRIMQTGDFLYMLKNYESEDKVDVDVSILESKFNEVVEDYVISIDSKNEGINDYGRYLAAQNEIKKIINLIDIIKLKIRTNKISEILGLEIDNSDIKELLSLIKVQKSDDLEKQCDILIVKINKYNNDIQHLKAKIEKSDKKENEDVDIDEQFMNVCLGLEMHVDEKKISLYQYGIMIKLLVK